ncbi:MAG: type I secretion system permease/ATPase [Caulobacteraceae bacterium]
MAEAVNPLRAAIKSCRKHFVWAAAFSALLNLLYIAPTLYMLQVYDRVVPARGDLTLLAFTVLLALALGTLTILDTLRGRMFTRASMRFDRRLTGIILNTAFGARGSSEAINKQVMREFDSLRQILTGPSMLALFDLPWLPIYLLVCFLLHPALGAVVTFGGGVLALLGWLNEQRTKSSLRRANEAANRTYAAQDRTLAAADVVRALGMRQAMINRQLADRETSVGLQMEANFISGGYVALSRFARLFLQSAALGVGAWLAIHDRISAGTIFAASFLAARALGPLEQVLGSWKNIGHARDAWRTVEQFLASVGANPPATNLPRPMGTLDVEAVSVRSPAGDRALLANINFRAEPGEIIALIGRSGAGKSTLLKAIAGITPYSGAIRFDSSEMKEYDPERLGAWIGYAPQDASLFPGTVKDNISRFAAHSGAPPEELDLMVIAAAKSCGVHEMIARLPAGYDTMVGWSGVGLSAGQAQRIALARALYGMPHVVLLDEPDAHLDGEGEVILARALQALKAVNRTTVVVSHRNHILSVADRIMVMRDGRLELDGPRNEVMERLTQAARRAQAPTAVPEPASAPPESPPLAMSA